MAKSPTRAEPILSSAAVHREFDPATINAILNHPEVLPHIVTPGIEKLDSAPLISDPNNVVLAVDGGCILFDWQEPGLYEIHTNFLPTHRGRYAYDAIQEMFRWVFTRTDCLMLHTRVPEPNRAATAMARRCGFSLMFRREKAWPTKDGLVPMEYFHLPYEAWARTASTFVASGKAYHDRLDAEYARHQRPAHDHEDEECHFRYAGAAFEMILGGQPEKGVGLYNRWARFSGYAPIALLSRNPVVVDIGESVLLMDKPEFKVIRCRA